MQGYFAFVTEIFDDSGRPHTLEHAVFMGSEKYGARGKRRGSRRLMTRRRFSDTRTRASSIPLPTGCLLRERMLGRVR